MQGMNRTAPLLTLLLALGAGSLTSAGAVVRLGDALPAHPWAQSRDDEDERELVVLYSHDCGDLGDLWSAVLQAGLPVHAVNAEEVASPAPKGLSVWRGPDATAFARALKVSAYPTVLLVRGGRVLNAWEGDFTAAAKL
ncbi:penicillin-binding protein [Deinococcus psychrotolerans]|uniref:Penicillin-binding protein n=2 Tax=Deinococcus TaxID=1298 RepID=A0A553UV61_9DEIO|nr:MULTISPECIES: penicillin-binding protein [Deinococcus]AZI43924.1 penicillin-binding protein [Deinococcus psychrotolerans]TSA83901.1 penicillin-binding protein [Deinococcus detaillensis]